MAVAKKKQIKKYKFELTRGAIAGIGVVCFCIFLWMFLFGVWTGQSLLMPSTLDPVTDMSGSHETINLSDQKKHRP
jgi:uncharacterized membrane protein